jgi:hypothetical protein
VVGTSRTLEVVTSIWQGSDKLLLFDGWADGAASPQLYFDAPASATTYTARYKTIRPGNGDGLNGSYYIGPQAFNRNQPVMLRVDSVIDFNRKDDFPTLGLLTDSLRVRWEGFIEPYHTDAYTFLISSGNEVDLWIDNQPMVMDSTLLPAAAVAGVILLEEGRKYPISLDLLQKTPGAPVTLSWRSRLLRQEIIPRSQLFTRDIITAVPAAGHAEERSKMVPNPFKAEAKVVLGNHYGETVLVLQDVTGRILTERLEFVNGAGTAIDLQLPVHAAPGIYFLRIQSKKKREVLRVAKF